jgi:hypothetical protein
MDLSNQRDIQKKMTSIFRVLIPAFDLAQPDAASSFCMPATKSIVGRCRRQN